MRAGRNNNKKKKENKIEKNPKVSNLLYFELAFVVRISRIRRLYGATFTH